MKKRKSAAIVRKTRVKPTVVDSLVGVLVLVGVMGGVAYVANRLL